MGTDIEGTDIEQQIRLGIDGYSVRGFRWNAFELIDYEASVEVDSVEVSRGAFESLEDEFLKKVKVHADRTGVAIFPEIGSICYLSVGYDESRQGSSKEKLLLGLRMAQILGASAIKCFLGGSSDRRDSVPIPVKILVLL